MPGKKEYIAFINHLADGRDPKQHDRVMRRTYEEKNKKIVTYVLLWKDPVFSNGRTAAYIAIDIHYRKDEKMSGYIGGVWAKGVPGITIKPEQEEDGQLAIAMCSYLEAVKLLDPPAKPDELQDFDGDFYRGAQDLDAYQDGPGQRRR